MAEKLRVYQLAKELGMKNPEIIGLLNEAGVEAKNHMSVLDDETVAAFRNVYKSNAVQVEKPEPVEEKPVQVAKAESKDGEIILTPEEQAIMRRVSGADDEWSTITEESMGDFSLSEDQYKFPPEAQAARDRKEFAFRWVAKTSARLDEITSVDPPMKWWVVNSTQPPVKGLNRHIDPVHGGIQRMDQILMFKPYWMFEKHQAAKTRIAQAKDASGDIKNRDGKKETWGEWRAGEQNKIDGGDVVMAEAADFDTAVGE